MITKIILVLLIICASSLCFERGVYAGENWQRIGENYYRQDNLNKAENCFVTL